jgi:hypothetical protein
MSMIRRTCENTQITQFIIQQLLTLHSTLLKSFWRKNQSTKFFLLFLFLIFSAEPLSKTGLKRPKIKEKNQLTDFF